MTMRPFTDARGGLNHLVDAQIGRAFPVVHKVYQHLDAIEYVAQVYESGRARDIVLRTNRTKEWIEWQYKGEAKWTILFKFSDLLGADIADVVAAEQAIATELVALRAYINQTRSDTLAASDRAQAAELGAVVAKDAAEAAQASASTSAQEASVSAVAAAQSAQGIHDVKAATEVIAATAETYRDAAAQSAQEAADSASSADSVKVFVVSARAKAEGFATTATTASTEAKAAQQAAESSAAAALTSENQASASALASAASEAATSAKLGEITTLHDAVVTASTTATGAAGTTTTHLAQVTALHSATETFAQAAQASAEQADIAATAAGVSASDALQLRNETQGFHDAASAMVVDAAQVSADRATVQILAQEVQLAANQAESNALTATNSADTAVASLTTVVTLHTEVVTKYADVLVKASQVSEDLLATTAAKGAAETAQADAETAEALARAWATKIGGPVLNDGVDKFSAQYWATQAKQSALDAADANAGTLANHTAAADPHTQYLTKAESTDVLATKVDAVVGKGLSTEDFTSTEKTKLAGIAAGAQVNTVTAVAGKTGNVALTKADVGLGNIDNTSDTNKPVSTATQNALNNKVDKEAGKQLSTEDYTAAEKTKLAGIDAGANAYTHPANHPASIITQDENNRFVTDAEKVAWNAKQNTLVSGTNIKTINGKSLLGGGDLVVAGGGGPTLQGDTSPYVNQTKTYQITNYNSFSSYAVSASAGTASISGDTITYTAPATAGSVGLTLTVDGQPAVFAVAVQAVPSYIPTPTHTPTNFGDPLEGGFYAGMVWGQIAQSSTSMAIATGSKTFTVADMSSAPIVYVGQMVEVRGRANPADKFVGTVTSAAGTSLTINVTSIGGSGTFSNWSVMARHRVIVAPKASGEHAGIALKNDNSALPTACQTLTEGFAATQAMRDADSSTVYPAAHWARNLNIGGRTDWYIPARDELELCWRNLKPVTTNNNVTGVRPTAASFNYANNGSYGDTTSTTSGLNNNSAPVGATYTASVPGQTAATAFRSGGAEAYEFGSANYWSSSDLGTSHAWYQVWASSWPGYQGNYGKAMGLRVRAVRRSII